MKASKLVSTRSVTTKLITTASVGALLLGLSATAQADNWRYAHEEYEGDVQDVFAYAFKEYIEENSDHTVQVYRFGELGESDDIMEQTQNGILQFVNQSPGFTGALIPEAHSGFSCLSILKQCTAVSSHAIVVLVVAGALGIDQQHLAAVPGGSKVGDGADAIIGVFC